MKMGKGFTLIEILITMAILSLIIGGIYGVLNIGNMTYSSDMGLVDLQQGVRQVMDGMIREVRQSGRTPPYNSVINSDGSLTFSIPDISDIKYYLDANSRQIMRQQPADTGTIRILTNNINSLNFCWWDGIDCCNPASEDCSNLYILQIRVDAAKTVNQRPVSFSLTEEARLRNQ